VGWAGQEEGSLSCSGPYLTIKKKNINDCWQENIAGTQTRMVLAARTEVVIKARGEDAMQRRGRAGKP